MIKNWIQKDLTANFEIIISIQSTKLITDKTYLSFKLDSILLFAYSTYGRNFGT